MSAMGSSKYEFEPDKFDEDYSSKIKRNKDFKNNVTDAVMREYKYIDGSVMSTRAKRELFVSVAKELLEKL